MRILIAEDDAVSCRVLSTTLSKWGHEVIVTRDGLEAWQTLRRKGAPSLAILDRMMPGMDGTEICRKIRLNPSTLHTYVILLTAMGSKSDLVEGLEAGADDYLVKPFDRHELKVRVAVGARIVELQRTLAERVRELEGAVAERIRAEAALRDLTLADDLSGLLNRRGFFTLAQHHLKSARRFAQNSLIIYGDMDGLKQINDTRGHDEGSRALCRMAEVLRATFRDSDILARLGGDEFAVLAADVSPVGGAVIAKRLRENLRSYNARHNHGYDLSLSIGSIYVHSQTTSTLEELLAAADEAMYEDKRARKTARFEEMISLADTGNRARMVSSR